MRVLVVEDEKKIASFIQKGLIEVAFNPVLCERGCDALDLATHESFDAIVLHVMPAVAPTAIKLRKSMDFKSPDRLRCR